MQGPGVAIGVAEGSVLDTLIVFLDLAHLNASADECFAGLGDVPDDQMRAPQRASLNGKTGQAGSNDDGAS